MVTKNTKKTSTSKTVEENFEKEENLGRNSNCQTMAPSSLFAAIVFLALVMGLMLGYVVFGSTFFKSKDVKAYEYCLSQGGKYYVDVKKDEDTGKNSINYMCETKDGEKIGASKFYNDSKTNNNGGEKNGGEGKDNSGENNSEGEGNGEGDGNTTTNNSGEGDTGNESDPNKVYDASNLTITVIGDDRCNDCDTADERAEILKEVDFLNGAKIVTQDFADNGVSDYLKEVGIKYLPAIILSTNDVDDEDMKQYLTKLSDGQYNLEIGSDYDAFVERSANGFLMLEKADYDAIKENLKFVDGNADAAITILEYSDIQCPYCAKLYTNGTIGEIRENYPDNVNIIFNHFPLSFHENALPGSIILECLGEEVGAEAFYKLLELSFTSGDSSKSYLIDKAVELGANKDSITKCSDEKTYEERVNKIQDLGSSTFGISGTPGSVIINNKTLEYEIIGGAYPYDSFKEIIDKLLASN